MAAVAITAKVAELRRYTGGTTPLTARDMDRLMGLLREMIMLVRPARGASNGLPLAITRATISTISGDYLTCAIPADAGALVSVAKPPLLRSVSVTHGSVTYSGYTVDGQERTATLGATTETQVVVPDYRADDELYIIHLASTDMLDASGDPLKDSAGTAIEWLDLNVDGRAWAKKAGT